MDDLALERVHGLEPLRLARPLHPASDPLRPRSQLGPSALPIVLDIDHDPAPRPQLALYGSTNQLLERVEGLAVTPDEEPHPLVPLAQHVEVHGPLVHAGLRVAGDPK